MLTGGFPNTATAEQLFGRVNAAQNFGKKSAEQSPAPATGLEWFSQMEMVDVTSISILPKEIEAPRVYSFFGYKIDLASKIADFKESYQNNYALTKSHNLLVARFAEFKTAAMGALLAMLGVPDDELEKMRKKVVRGAIQQNKSLFEENEYNGELLSVIGASKKTTNAQNKVLAEVRGQLLIQAKNLGLEDFYSREMILEIRLEQCRKILEKFLDEKKNLECQSQMIVFGVN